jgi:dehydrogenase/reductase SDR family protein 12
LQAAAAGARVTAIARSRDKLESLVHAAGALGGTIEPVARDLSLTASIRDLVATDLPTRPPVDVLVNNVGVLLRSPATTTEGLDAAFATNLLNPWLLTRLMTQAEALGSGAAVITMSSGGMYNVPLNVAALESQDRYEGALAYAHHKRAQVVLNAHLRETEAAGRQHYVMHPGWVDTPGVETSLPDFHRLLKPLLRDTAAGADTALWLAARRPAQSRPEGIWFDRALRPAHALPGSRQGDDVAALLSYLQRRAEEAVDTQAAPGAGTPRADTPQADAPRVDARPASFA